MVHIYIQYQSNNNNWLRYSSDQSIVTSEKWKIDRLKELNEEAA
jgi:hypothetical protein